MGWSFACDPRHDKKACVEHLTRPGAYSEGYTILRHRVVGNHLWQLLQRPCGQITIDLYLLAGGGHQGMGWGWKGISEEMGPYYYDCPLSFLDDATPGNAAEWRQKVREYHAAKKLKTTLQTGSIVSYCGHQYQLECPAGPRKGWRVNRVSDGRVFRMNARQLSQAKVIL